MRGIGSIGDGVVLMLVGVCPDGHISNRQRSVSWNADGGGVGLVEIDWREGLGMCFVGEREERRS